jgi:hypothetical protein
MWYFEKWVKTSSVPHKNRLLHFDFYPQFRHTHSEQYHTNNLLRRRIWGPHWHSHLLTYWHNSLKCKKVCPQNKQLHFHSKVSNHLLVQYHLSLITSRVPTNLNYSYDTLFNEPDLQRLLTFHTMSTSLFVRPFHRIHPNLRLCITLLNTLFFFLQ